METARRRFRNTTNGSASSYQITITAINGTSSTQQTFTIDVSPAATTTTTTTTTLRQHDTTLPTATTTTLPVTTTVGVAAARGGVAPTTPLTQPHSHSRVRPERSDSVDTDVKWRIRSGALSYKVTDPGTAGARSQVDP